MDLPEYWVEINEILEAALEKEPEQRSRFLDQACRTDTGLRREVESLLNLETGDLQRLDRPAFEMFTSVSDGDRRPDRIGPYEIRRELGRGGSAEVVLARRVGIEDRRNVAIKILRPGLDSADMADRLRREGHILSRLRHPFITEVYGGGTAEGRGPYLVMEYIDGIGIDAYCESRALSVRQRLELFEKVCAAVQFAHQHLVIHRDLKPTNILVRDDGEPKLLDFGIAKLLDPLSTGRQTATLPSLRRMTPRYASPEQVQGEMISTASDIYSLGVVLYELLTGLSPYGPGDYPPSEMLRRIREQAPMPPSSAVVRSANGVDPGADGKRLARQLAGDLDNILLEALRKVPSERYASVEQLAQDIRRHLEGRPVRAREATLLYRATKFLGRRKKAVAAAFLVAWVLGAFALQRESQQREIARQRDRAEKVTEVLVGLFEESDPETGRGRETPVGEILDRSLNAIDRLEGQEAIRADLLTILGRVHRNLGLYELGGQLLEQAIEGREQIFGPHHVEVAESLDELGDVRYKTGRYEEAEALFRRSLAIRRKELGESHPEVADALAGLGTTLTRSGDLETAEEVLRQALTIRRDAYGQEHRDIALSLGSLASLLMNAGDLDESERLYRQAIQMARSLLAPEDLQLARMHCSLAELVRQRGELDEAESLMRQGLRGLREGLGEEHPDIGIALMGLANILLEKEELEASESSFRESLQILERSLGENHANVGQLLISLALLSHEKGEPIEAKELFRKALGILRLSIGEDHPAIASAMINLALVEEELGELEEAESLFRGGLRILHSSVGPEHSFIASGLHNLAGTLAQQGKLEEAEENYRNALTIHEKLLGERHPMTAETQLELALVLQARGQTDTEPTLSKVLDVYREHYDEGHWRLATVESALGEALSCQGRFEEAEPLLRRSHQTLVEQRGPSDSTTRAAAKRLADHLERRTRPAPKTATQ
ncbi:MAG: tetratricopeptide repeat protein [Holophagales bacterium]|nr:tetratricopeptide repeat protein [Holophagales bacterium]